MRKLFYSLAIALVALMVSIPAKAGNVYNAGTWDDLYKLFSLGTDPSTHTAVGTTDTIRLTANITFVTGVHEGSLCVLSNKTRTLDLNGYTLEHDPNKAISSQPYAITMNDNSVLNILDSRGGGQLVNNSSGTWALPFTNNWANVTNYRYSVSSACIANFYTSRDNEPSRNCTVNLYGGSLIAKHISEETNLCSSVFCRPKIVPNVIEPELAQKYEWAYMLDFNGGGYFEDPNMTVNVYGGSLGSVRAYKYTSRAWDADKATYDYYDSVARSHLNDRVENYLTYTTKEYCGNPVKVNLYGGNIGHSGMSLHALNCDKGFSGTLQEGTIYGISSQDNLNNFQGVSDAVSVYLNGTKTTVNALKNQDLSNKTVRFEYAPDITVANIAVTRDNCDDILPWEEFKASFDYATNTLYLKSLSNPTNVLNGIQFSDFDLRIVVDGYWRINGSIVGTNGDLTITANHFALTEEDGDILAIHSQNSTAVSLNGKSFCAKNRVRVVIDDNNTNTQTAVSCGMFVINNAWFDAWGKKPIVDCQNSMITNANITKYVVWVDVNDKSAGTVTGDGLVNEGVSHTVTATPKSGYHFLRWSNGVTENPYTFVVTQDTALYALFEADVVINYYDIRVASADETMGTVSGGGTHLEQGQTVTITATPNEGYQFLYWTTADGQVQGAISQWTVTKDETLIAHFRVAPPADAYNLWVCGTQVTGSNSADILGDGVWCYDHETHTLTVMKDATYNLTNSEFISDFVSGVGTLTINVGNHKLGATCTTTDEVIRTAIWSSNGIIFTGTTYHGLTFTAQNMYPANVKTLTVTGHMDLTINLKNTTEFGKKWFSTAVLLGSVTPSLIVDGANLYINSGVGESAGSGYKATNKTDQAANLSMNNASIQWGSISSHDLGILDDSPKYEINYLTPALESLCLTSAFGLSFFEGTHFNLYAYPATGYKFVSWSDGNTDNPRLIIMPAHNVYLDPIVEVDESQNPKGAIINASATEGQGSITGFTSGWYAEGTELTITAVPAEGYKFVQWSDGEVSNPYFITVEDKKNINITAMFEPTTTTAVSNVESQQASIESRKVLRNGILFIERNGKIYDARGIEVN